MTPSHLFAAVVDDVFMCKALARLLRANGYEVEAFPAGARFRQSACAGAVDCVVLDVHMPALSGLDVPAVLQARRVPVPIIFISACDDIALRERALQQWAAAYLRKPLTEQTLLAAIALRSVSFLLAAAGVCAGSMNRDPRTRSARCGKVFTPYRADQLLRPFALPTRGRARVDG